MSVLVPEIPTHIQIIKAAAAEVELKLAGLKLHERILQHMSTDLCDWLSPKSLQNQIERLDKANTDWQEATFQYHDTVHKLDYRGPKPKIRLALDGWI